MAACMLHRLCDTLASYPCRPVVLDVEHLPAVLRGGVERLGRYRSGITLRRYDVPIRQNIKSQTRVVDTTQMPCSCECVSWQLSLHNNETDRAHISSQPLPGAFYDLRWCSNVLSTVVALKSSVYLLESQPAACSEGWGWGDLLLLEYRTVGVCGPRCSF